MSDGTANDDGAITARDGIAPGAIVASKYRVLRALASGGMGRLVVARQLELERDVVIKVMHTELVSDELMTKRFFREAQLLAALESDHVVKILDVGRLDDGTPYLVMELLEGEDLETRGERGPIAIGDALRWAVEACAGLAEAHACGVTHRDVKPQNLFLARSRSGVERVKVLDFGIAKRDAGTSTSKGATTGDAIIGSPAFMAPEQITSSRDVDARADVWSLGATLYQLLAGSPPFRADDNIKLLAKILHAPVPALLVARPEVGAELAAIVHACLAKKPKERPQTMKELSTQLAAVRVEKPPTPAKKKGATAKRRPPIMLLAFLTTVLAGAALFAWQGRSLVTVKPIPTSDEPSASSSSPAPVSVTEPPSNDANEGERDKTDLKLAGAMTAARPSATVKPAIGEVVVMNEANAPKSDGGPPNPVFIDMPNPHALDTEERQKIFTPTFKRRITGCVSKSDKFKSASKLGIVLKWNDVAQVKPTLHFGWFGMMSDADVRECVSNAFLLAVPWRRRGAIVALSLTLRF